MKKTLLTACLAITGLFASAQEQLNIVLTDSSYISYSFSESPKVTTEATNVCFNTAAITVRIPMSRIKRFTFGQVPDDITALPSVSVTTPYDNENKDVVTEIRSMAGVQVRRIPPGNPAGAALQLSGLPKGLYIVKKGRHAHVVKVY